MRPSDQERVGALFVMPRSSSSWIGSEALWVTVAGWSAAAKRHFGNAWVLTTDGICSPEQVLEFPNAKKTIPSFARRMGRWIPSTIKTLLKDLSLWRSRNRKDYPATTSPWGNTRLAFVWEQHDLFHGPGSKIAASLGVPLVLYVHAPVVWESSRWGVKRPGWGVVLEKLVESRSLRSADLVACVSSDVAAEVGNMGVAPGRIVVSPMSVDAEYFSSLHGDHSIRKRFNLEDKLVVGWTGSFRSFHGVKDLVRAFKLVAGMNRQARLLMVGDGPERKDAELLVDQLDLGKEVIFAGRVPFKEMPLYLCSFDVGVVSAANTDDFHYSPLKLREYMAAKCAVVAAAAGEVPKLFADRTELLLYQTGNVDSLSEKILSLLSDGELRNKIALSGFKRIMDKGTWDYELHQVLERLKPPRP